MNAASRRNVALGTLVGFVFLLVLFADRAEAYNTCVHPQGYCGSHYYSGISWRDDTGWTGAKATAISSSGTTWHGAGAVSSDNSKASGQ
jgi:hypothetical protein